MRSLLAVLLLALSLAAPGGAGTALAASPFSDWAGVIVAGDFRAHGGATTETFDNARRDLHRAFVSTGFKPENLRQFSVRPDRYPGERLMVAEPGLIGSQLAQAAGAARGGCLVYFTTHGTPEGVVVGMHMLSPAGLSRMVDAACGARPTVVVISACFSGVFVPALSSPGRMVLTAARPDRSSFGCGESDRYPYFDACMLEALPKSSDFNSLGSAVQTCVAGKEKETGMSPASEPQVFLGSQFRPLAPLLPLHVGAPAAPGQPPAGAPAP